jgi:hypothetical protein
MNDGYATRHEGFAAFLTYLFGEECLTQIVSGTDDRGKRCRDFHCDVPSLDAQEYYEEFNAGNLAITDLRAFINSHSRLNFICRTMHKNGDSTWTSPSWVNGRS